MLLDSSRRSSAREIVCVCVRWFLAVIDGIKSWEWIGLEGFCPMGWGWELALALDLDRGTAWLLSMVEEGMPWSWLLVFGFVCCGFVVFTCDGNLNLLLTIDDGRDGPLLFFFFVTSFIFSFLPF